MANNFKEDYQLLNLDDRADWNTARDSYRRLIKTWHPDRFAQRPREQMHAQQRFIELTGAYNRLRTFQRENQRMPFQPLSGAAQNPAAGAANESAASRKTATLLGDSKPQRRAKTRVHAIRWVVPVSVMVVGTLSLFLWLDRNNKLRHIEQAKEVLRETEPSEFMPSAREVQRNKSRGAYVEGEKPGKLGDQLMPDVFR